MSVSPRFRCLVACSIGLVLMGTVRPTYGQALPGAASDLGATVQVQEASASVVVDGVLNETVWQQATVIPMHYEWLPGDNIAPPVRTEVLLTYDAERLYVAFRAFDDRPGEIRAHLMDRDDIQSFVEDDHVGFMVDPFNDERRAFQFRINPLGVQVDGVFNDLDGTEDFSWDIIWDSAGRVTADGYVVELAIPFNQLRYPAASAVQTWGFTGFRSWPRSVRHRIQTQPRDRGRNCLLCQFLKVEGFQGMSAGRNVEVTPTLTVRRTDARDGLTASSLEAGPVEPEVGFTGRWGVTSNLTLNATVNPDFSQVEADVAQLEVNERFALFFPERRPFFLEGLDFFQTPLDAIFTRTVVDPVAGAKVTSKVGPHAVGVFAAQDRVNNLLLPANQQSGAALLDREVSSGVVRYRRDVGAGSAVGVLYTGRESRAYRNHVGGLDGFFRLSRANTLVVQALRSQTAYPAGLSDTQGAEGEAFHGAAVFAAFNHVSRYWIASASYEDRSPGFRADAGFIPRVDVRTADVDVTRRFWGSSTAWFSQLNIGAGASQTYDYAGRLTDQQVGLDAFYRGPLQSQLLLRLDVERTRFQETLFDLYQVNASASVQPNGRLRIGLSGRVGETVDVVEVREAQTWRVGPRAGLKLGPHVRMSLDYLVQRLYRPEGRLLTEQLLQARIVYHVNVRLFLRATTQLRMVDRNVAAYTADVPSRQESLFTQLLFSYTVNPQTVVFVGYADNHGADAVVDLTQLDRTFFLKMGYAWVF
ncbi:MAG: DUF5916 domain-containing protein [Bacteroidota bacterium]